MPAETRGPSQGYAVVDVETTGLRASMHDRIVEIAIVRLNRELAEIDAWTTLVNPQRDVGARSIHGISALAIVDAPTFTDIAGDVLMRLADMVLVGHNVSFDTRFLLAEFDRCGWDLPEWDGLCTLELAAIVGTSGSRRLEACCRAAGIHNENAHTAAGDARATAALLRYYLRSLGPAQCAELIPAAVPAADLPAVRPSGRVWLREQASAAGVASSLEAIVRRLPAAVPAVEGSPTALLGYVDLLDRVVEDRVVSAEEAAALGDFALSHGLDAATVADIHRSYLTSLIAIALHDEKLTDLERDDLTRVASALGMRDLLDKLLAAAGPAVHSALASLRAVAHAASSAAPAVPPVDRRAELRGKTVCFTGESVCGFDREQQELLAAAAGMVPSSQVTKRLDILVVADPASQSGKALKAAQYGIRRFAERPFWQALGIETA